LVINHQQGDATEIMDFATVVLLSYAGQTNLPAIWASEDPAGGARLAVGAVVMMHRR